MRYSSFTVGLAAISGASAWSSSAAATTVAVIQQIGDGQIQNPVSPTSYAVAPPASSAYAPAPPASSAYAPKPSASSAHASAPPVSAPAAPPAVSSAAASAPAYGNATAIITNQNTKTISKSKSAAASATSSVPAVQTGAANTMVGSTVGLGMAVMMAALLG